MQAHTTRNEPIFRRSAERQQHRAEGGQTDADEPLPPVPTLPDDYVVTTICSQQSNGQRYQPTQERSTTTAELHSTP
eukprot:1882706-Amphidinium_carterae.1